MIDPKEEENSELDELSNEWCYYSGMPSPMAYMNLSEDDEDSELSNNELNKDDSNTL